MGAVKNDNFITIQGWMINELKLSGNTLLVYAIIYGFSQDEDSVFSGSLQYLADWCNATKQGIQKNLRELLDKGLIVKREIIKNNQKFCEYSCIPCNKVVYPMQQSCTNKIEDNIGYNTNTNVLVEDEKPKKKNLYNKCCDYIMQYTNNVPLQDALTKFLTLRLEIARTECKPFYYNMWPPIVNELDGLAHSTEEAINIVKQSTTKGWKKFYALKTYSNQKTIKSEDYENDVHTSKNRDIVTTDEVY